MGTDYGYAWRHGWGWIAYYVRFGRLIAALRQTYHVLFRGYIGEACQFCGRRYVLWHAPNAIWNEVIGDSSGLSCPSCFDQRCAERGIWLHWTPELWEDYIAHG